MMALESVENRIKTRNANIMDTRDGSSETSTNINTHLTTWFVENGREQKHTLVLVYSNNMKSIENEKKRLEIYEYATLLHDFHIF